MSLGWMERFPGNIASSLEPLFIGRYLTNPPANLLGYTTDDSGLGDPMPRGSVG
jgi:hypothetical protein